MAPYGVISLVSVARSLAGETGRRVRLANLSGQLHSYLERMDLFRIGEDWIESEGEVHNLWLRNPMTDNLLELTTISGPSDVESAVARARMVFSQVLGGSSLGELCTVLSELCANIYQHSGDRRGCVLIQRYGSPAVRRVTVDLAVGDLGRGVRASLSDQHGSLGKAAIDYLRAAMHGKTARASGRGGFGLQRVKQIVKERQGYLWLRSDNAAILSVGCDRSHELTDLARVPGTQLAVELQTQL